MDLTLKDKITFYITELRNKLPLSDEPKKQLWVFGGAIGGSSIILYILLVVSIANPNIISSSHNSISRIPHISPTTISVTPQLVNDRLGIPQQNGQSQAAGTTGTGGTQNSSATQTQSGKSEVVLQSKPFPTPSSSGGGSASSSNGGGTRATPTPGGAVIGTTDLSNISLLTQPGSGTPVQNGPTPTPPVDLTWSVYYNARENYSIAYPVGWQAVKAIYNNHEGVALYPPDSISQGQAEEIGFGISQFSYGMPGVTTGDASSIADILVDGYPGKLYSSGSLQANTVAAVFKYGNNYFGLGGTSDNAAMIYVFTHMLSSLQLYGGSY